MPLPRYTPPIARLQEDYSSMIAARVRKARRERERGPRPPRPKIPDNSEPWLENPSSVADCIWIAQQVQELVNKWGPHA